MLLVALSVLNSLSRFQRRLVPPKSLSGCEAWMLVSISLTEQTNCCWTLPPFSPCIPLPMSPHLFSPPISLLLAPRSPPPSLPAVLTPRAWRRWISSNLQQGSACNEAFVFVLWAGAVSKLNWMFSPRSVPLPFQLPTRPVLSPLSPTFPATMLHIVCLNMWACFLNACKRPQVHQSPHLVA